MFRRAHVVLAEDDREFRHLLAGVLRKDGYLVDEAENGLALLDRLWERAGSNDCFDLIISDILMPGATGLDVLEGLRDQCAPDIGETPIILITAFGDEHVYAEAARLQARIFDKPFDIDALRGFALSIVPSREAIDSTYTDHGGEA